MTTRRTLLAASALTWGLLAAPAGAADAAGHCVFWLEPVSAEGDVIQAEPVPLGCYETYADAVAAGSGGSIQLEDAASPATVTDTDLEDGTVSTSSSVAIGTEYNHTSYQGASNTYFASTTCSDTTTWEVAYVGDAWNDTFESGKGFGGCDRNRKFKASQFDGDSILCTPNCSTYGALRNEVSSLRWRH
jgi:hypothetical protein